MTPLQDFYKDWIQCESYDILTKIKVCKGLDGIYKISEEIGISLFLDQWLVHILIFMFIAAISVMLFASLTEEQLCLKEIRAKVGNNWFSLLNLIYAIRLTQELSRRNENLLMDIVKNKVIAKQEKTKSVSVKKEEHLETKNSSLVVSPTVSTISQISPRTKRPKLDKDSGIDSMNFSDSESQKRHPSLNSMDLLEALRKNQSLDHSVDSDKLVAPPSSPVTSPSTPRSKESMADMNISSSIKCGIFEKRKKFFEQNEFENVSPRKTKSESSSCSTSSLSSDENNLSSKNRVGRRPHIKHPKVKFGQKE